MSYSLQAIHDIVFNALQPTQLLPLKEDALGLLWQKAYDTVNNLPAEMLKQVCGAKNNKEKKAMVHSCQAATIAMANCLHGYAKTLSLFPLHEPVKQEQAAACRELRDQLINSLHILDYFPAYLDKNLPLPDHVFETEKENIQIELLRIEDEWKKRIEPALLMILLQPFKDFGALSSSLNPTSRMLGYLYLLAQKTKSLSVACPKDAGTAMIYLLVHLNFNDDSFISYAAKNLRPDLLDKGTRGYILQYTHMLNNLKHIRPMASVALVPDMPSCQSGLVVCMQEEITLLTTEIGQVPLLGNPLSSEPSTKKPIRTCLNMSQLAVMLRWCHKTNILSCETAEELFKLVAQNVETAGKEQYRPSSLRTEYYEMDPAAASVAKDYIIHLLNEAKKN